MNKGAELSIGQYRRTAPSFSFSYAVVLVALIPPMSNAMNNVPKNIAMSNKKLKPASNSRKSPPRNGPVKLPMLKKIPHNKLPVGNNCFGVNSDIYDMPSE